MNYLSHHAVARAVSAINPEIDSAAFFVGNVLPDLLSVSGDGRLRAASVLAPPPGTGAFLVSGIRLHLATDKRFHGHPLFAEAMQEASKALRAAPFSIPLRRVFFLAHAFVEIALDGWLIQQDMNIARNFYARFEACDLATVVTDAGRLLGRETPLLGLAHTLERFTESQYLFSYAEESGMAEALYRICHRVRLADLFADSADKRLLGECFGRFLPEIARSAGTLLAPPDNLFVIQ